MTGQGKKVCYYGVAERKNTRREELGMQKKRAAGDLLAKLAYHEAKKSVNEACYFNFYQPKLPEALKKLKNNSAT